MQTIFKYHIDLQVDLLGMYPLKERTEEDRWILTIMKGRILIRIVTIQHKENNITNIIYNI